MEFLEHSLFEFITNIDKILEKIMLIIEKHIFLAMESNIYYLKR